MNKKLRLPITFFSSLILLIGSLLLDVEVFTDIKILVMIASFALVNLSLVLLMIFAIAKSASGVVNSDVGRIVGGKIG